MIPCSYWASACVAVLPSYTTFMISVRQVKVLPPASFRFHLTMDTLALGYSLPATGRLRDFHPLEYAPAGRTTKSRRTERPALRLLTHSPCPTFMTDLLSQPRIAKKRVKTSATNNNMTTSVVISTDSCPSSFSSRSDFFQEN